MSARALPLTLRAIVFDAYGTIFDVHSIARLADTIWPGRGDEVSALWRVKQIDYTRLRTLSDRYESFSRITRDALMFATRALGLALDAEAEGALMIEYDRLAVFPDSAATLGLLKNRGIPLAILSNGDPPMLRAVVENNGLDGVFDHLLSVDSVGRFKTAPEAYELGPLALGCPARDILFVSSNCWDACGATWFGYPAFWINRASQPLEELGVKLAGTGPTMAELLPLIDRYSVTA